MRNCNALIAVLLSIKYSLLKIRNIEYFNSAYLIFDANDLEHSILNPIRSTLSAEHLILRMCRTD